MRQLKPRYYQVMRMSLVGAVMVSMSGFIVGNGGCTQQQAKQAGQAIVQIAVDTCQEAPQLAPPGIPQTVVSLICAAVDVTAPAVQVLLDAKTWNAMKSDYLMAHGTLPKGMSLPAPYAPTPSK